MLFFKIRVFVQSLNVLKNIYDFSCTQLKCYIILHRQIKNKCKQNVYIFTANPQNPCCRTHTHTHDNSLKNKQLLLAAKVTAVSLTLAQKLQAFKLSPCLHNLLYTLRQGFRRSDLTI